MSNYYTEYIKSTIIYFVEEGEKSLNEISKICNVSLFFVKKVRDEYEIFYVNISLT